MLKKSFAEKLSRHAVVIDKPGSSLRRNHRILYKHHKCFEFKSMINRGTLFGAFVV